MKHTSNLTKIYKNDFNLNEIKFRRIVDIVTEHYKGKENKEIEIYFIATRKDKIVLEADKIDDILNDGNSQGREVVKLKIKANDKKNTWDSSVEILFDMNKEYSSLGHEINLTINEKDDASSYILFDELDSLIETIIVKNKSLISYYFFRTLDIAFPFGILFIVCFLINRFTGILSQAMSEIKVYQMAILIAAIIFSAFYTIMSLDNKDYLFSKLLRHLRANSGFIWGDKTELINKRSKLIENIIWVIIIGSIVSVVTSIITSYLSK